MKLITKEILKRIPTWKNNHEKNPIIHFKLFTPWSNWTWFIAQYDPKTGDMYGMVHGFENEWGYSSLPELEEIRGPGGLKIERDRWFKPCRYSEIKH